MALAGQEVHGSISALSRVLGLSRPTVYGAGEVLRGHFDKDESAHRVVRVEVDEAQVARAVVALRVMAPNAIRPIEGLLPILYPGIRLCYRRIQCILARAEERAQGFNAKAELSPIKASALDEMFSQGEPVLAGVDLASGYLRCFPGPSSVTIAFMHSMRRIRYVGARSSGRMVEVWGAYFRTFFPLAAPPAPFCP